ncbi:MAG TPA: hypothetical protein VL282_03475 [Tepidisphaeraceae bacterium]|jgi:hypothetical protein|nr:hypothetical protein [Tepidisphaeraceae bacterium]
MSIRFTQENQAFASVSHTSSDGRSTAYRRVLLGLMLLAGAALWLNLGQIWLSGLQVQVGLVVAIVALIPRVNRFLAEQIERLRNPSWSRRTMIAVAISIVAIAYLYLTAVYQGRNFQMIYHDEFMFRLQTQMAAHGRLWMPRHPLGDFFDTFYVLVDPVYAGIYFPGTALMYAPSIWLKLPAWMLPLVFSGICVGLTYRIVCELVDGAAGILAAILILGTGEFRRIAIMNLGQPPSLLLGLMVIWAYLHWRRSPRQFLWSTVIGLLAGWSAIVRPVDGLCFAIPVGVAMAIELPRTGNNWFKMLGGLLAGAAPFLILQIIFNVGVTGHWSQSPVQYYLERQMPGLSFGFSTPPAATQPVSSLPQKQVLYDRFIRPFIDAAQGTNPVLAWYKQWPREIPNIVLPFVMLLVLMPLALLARGTARAWVFVGPLLVFLLLYPLYPSFLPHYLFIIMPACAGVVVLGLRGFVQSFPSRQRFLGTVLSVALVGLVLAHLPETDSRIRDQFFYRFLHLAYIEDNLAKLPHEPAIVLFRFHPENNPHEEPVHNVDAPWPDDERMIRANDLGPRNRELFAYYAQRQPNREVYLYDRGNDSIRHLGNVRQLAAQGDGAQ